MDYRWTVQQTIGALIVLPTLGLYLYRHPFMRALHECANLRDIRRTWYSVVQRRYLFFSGRVYGIPGMCYLVCGYSWLFCTRNLLSSIGTFFCSACLSVSTRLVLCCTRYLIFCGIVGCTVYVLPGYYFVPGICFVGSGRFFLCGLFLFFTFGCIPRKGAA